MDQSNRFSDLNLRKQGLNYEGLDILVADNLRSNR